MKAYVFWITVFVISIGVNQAARPYWTEAGEDAVKPSKDVYIAEHSPPGTLIWDSQPVDPNGKWVDVTFKWVNLKPRWGCDQCLMVQKDGKVKVDNDAKFNFERWNHKTPGGPHIVIELVARDGDRESTDVDYNIILNIYLMDEPDMPMFLNLPIVKSYPETAYPRWYWKVFRVAYWDPDKDSIIKCSIDVNPPGLFTLEEKNFKIWADREPHFDVFHIPQYNITVTLTDGTFTIVSYGIVNIIPDPHPPYFYNLPASTVTAEDTPVGTIVYTVNCTDVNNDTYEYAVLPKDGVLHFDNVTGNVKILSPLDYEQAPEYIYSLVGSDVTGLTSLPVTFTLAVTDVNEPCTITNLPASYKIMDSATAGQSIHQVHAEDLDGDTLLYTLTTQPLDGPFAISQTGEVTLNENPGLNGVFISQYVLTVEIADPWEFTDRAAITVDIVIINDPPLFSNLPQEVSVVENAIDEITIFTVESHDHEEDVITYSMTVDQPDAPFGINTDNGEITMRNDPGLDFELINQYILTIRATDDREGLFSEDQLTLLVTDVNEAPLITNLPADLVFTEDVSEEQEVFVVQTGDPEADPITFTIASLTTESFTITDTGSIVLIANPGFDFETSTTHSLTVTSSDGSLTDTQTITVIIEDVNEAPELINMPAVVDVEESESEERVIFLIEAIDEDVDDAWTISMTTEADPMFPFSLDETGSVSLVSGASLDHEVQSQYVMSVTVMDSFGLSSQSQLIINITDVNEPPVFDQTQVSVIELSEDAVSGVSVCSVSAVDPEAQDIMYSVADPEAAVFAIDNTGIVSVLAPLDFETDAAYQLFIQASDDVLTTTLLVNITIIDINEPPHFDNLPGSATILEDASGTSVVFSLVASDVDAGDVITFEIIEIFPPGGPFVVAPDTVDISVSEDAVLDYESVAEYQLIVKVSDVGLLFGYGNLTINIEDVNEPPEFVIPNVNPMSMEVEETIDAMTELLVLNATDPEQDVLTFSMEVTPLKAASFILDPTGGSLSIGDPCMLDYFVVPSYTLMISVSDGELTTTTQIDITIIEIPEPPIFHNLPHAMTLSEFTNETIYILKVTDPENNTMTFSMEDSAGGDSPFIIDPDTGDISIPAVPGLDFETCASHTLTITVTDEGGESTTDMLSITVTDEQEPPIVNNLPSDLSIEETEDAGPTVVFTVDVYEPEGDVLTYTVTSYPEEGIFDVDQETGDILYKELPDFDFERTEHYDLVITVTDGNFDPIVNNLSISIVDINEAPVIWNLPDSVDILEDVTHHDKLFEVNATDEDTGDLLRYKIESDPSDGNGKFTMDSFGGYFYVNFFPGLDSDLVDHYDMMVTVTDSEGLFANKTLTVNVIHVNEPPKFNVSNMFVKIDEEVAIGMPVPVYFYAYDPDGPKVDYKLVDNEHGRYFNFHPHVQQITVLKRLDRDHKHRPMVYRLQVSAEDVSGEQTILPIAVYVNDINDNQPYFQKELYEVEADHYMLIDTIIMKIKAFDKDSSSANSEISEYRLGGPGSYYFSVDIDGFIRKRFNMLHNVGTHVTMEVIAIDSGEPALSGTTKVSVHFAERLHDTILFENEFYNFEIWYDAVGEAVGKISAVDNNKYNTITYHLVNSTGQFGIDETSGLISVASHLPPGKTYILNAAAMNNKVPQERSSIISVRVDVYEARIFMVDIFFNHSHLSLDEAKHGISQLISNSALVRPIYRNDRRIVETNLTPGEEHVKVDTDVLTVVVLKSNQTDSEENVSSAKDMYTVPEIMLLFLDDEGRLRSPMVLFPHSHEPGPSSPSDWRSVVHLVVTVGGGIFSGVTAAVFLVAGVRKLIRHRTRMTSLKKVKPPRRHSPQLTNIKMNSSSPLPPKEGIITTSTLATVPGAAVPTMNTTHGAPVQQKCNTNLPQKKSKAKPQKIKVKQSVDYKPLIWKDSGKVEPELMEKIVINHAKKATITDMLPGFSNKPY